MLGVAKEHLKKNLADWKEGQVDRQGLVLCPLFYAGKIQAEALYAFGKGYGALVRGMSYHDLTQATYQAFDDPGERELFKKMIERHMDPAQNTRTAANCGSLSMRAETRRRQSLGHW